MIRNFISGVIRYILGSQQKCCVKIGYPIFKIMEEKSKKINPKEEFISLLEMSKFTNYSQEYLSLLCRQGKLKGKKIGRNWVTTKKWLDEYQAKTQYANGAKPAKINVRIKKEKAPQLFNIFKKLKYSFAMPLVFLFIALPLFLIFAANFPKNNFYQLSDAARYSLGCSLEHSRNAVNYSLEHSRNAVNANADKIAQKIISTDNSLYIIEKQTGEFAGQKISSLQNSAFALLGENETLNPASSADRDEFQNETTNGKLYRTVNFNASIISLSDFLNRKKKTDNFVSRKIISASNALDNAENIFAFKVYNFEKSFLMADRNLSDSLDNVKDKFSSPKIAKIVLIFSDIKYQAISNLKKEIAGIPSKFSRKKFFVSNPKKIETLELEAGKVAGGSTGAKKDLALEKIKSIESGVAVVPSGEEFSFESEESLIKKLNKSFSDEVIIEVDENGASGKIKLADSTVAEEYIFLIVPVDGKNTMMITKEKEN